MNFETLRQLQDYLFNLVPSYEQDGKTGYKPSLDKTYDLLRALGDPHRAGTYVHVAGTNGKGSVCAMLAGVLVQVPQLKVGLYTSPHLLRLTERFKINGKEVPEPTIIQFFNKYANLIEELKPSFFECTTAFAFWYFSEEQCDIIVLETGLGGRLDCTNVIIPEVSVITSIGYDHQDILGNTLVEIAYEKAGIIKNGVPVVIGEVPPEAEAVFRNKAKEKSANVVISSEKYLISGVGYLNDYYQCTIKDSIGKEKNYLLPVHGEIQAKNLTTVLTALDCLKVQLPQLTEGVITEGLRSFSQTMGFRGRYEWLANSPVPTIADVAHNEEGLRIFFDFINKIFQNKQLHIVIGFLKDKNLNLVLERLPTNSATTKYYWVTPENPKGITADIVASQAIGFGLSGGVFANPVDGLEEAWKHATTNDLVIVIGSFYVVAPILNYIDSLKVEK
jgi:dihydrofolate synthase/folylpolyglutamate synthase